MTLTIAAEVSGDHMNAVNVVGLIICMTGISVHVISKALDGKLYSSYNTSLQWDSLQLD